MAKAKVAVITRTRDRTLFLDRAIRSVHEQSMRDFVHIIINDGGDSQSVNEVVEKHSKLISGRVKVIHNTSSKGMEAASNKAIKSVDSTFVAIHDDDDTWHKDFLKETVSHLEKTDSMGVVVTTDRIDEVVEDESITKTGQSRWMPDLKAISLYNQCLDNHMTPITFLYRRDAFESVGYYDESLIVCGDWDFGIRFIRQYDVDFLATKNALAYYHHRPYVPGKVGNSIFGGNNYHDVYLTKLLNKYLREDIRNGTFGVGYIMNSLRDRQARHSAILTEIDAKTVRIEGHINRTADQVNQHTRDVSKVFNSDTLKRVLKRRKK